MGCRDDPGHVVLNDQGDAVSRHADTIRAGLPSRNRETVWYTEQESEAMHAALDALLAENQQLREALEIAPMPVTVDVQPWDEAYGHWWRHARNPLLAREALAGDAE